MFSLNGTLKKVGRSGDGKRNYLLGWPNGQAKESVDSIFMSYIAQFYYS